MTLQLVTRALIAGLPLGFALPVFAATTGSVTITGSVPTACSIIVTPAAGAVIADLTAGASNLLVATVTESCNAPNGYTVDMVGTNSGTYTGRFIDSVSGDTLNFSVTYNAAALASTRVTNVNAPGIALAKLVKISYPANSTLTAAALPTYSETLGFTITAK